MQSSLPLLQLGAGVVMVDGCPATANGRAHAWPQWGNCVALGCIASLPV